MATIETLVAQIEDPALRGMLTREIAELKRRLEWGLVFERHLPERARMLSAPVRPGSVVWERGVEPRRFRVRSVAGAELVVVPEPENTTAAADTPTLRVLRSAVLVEMDFADPISPVLTSIGALRNGPPDRPYHVVIEGENYHAIQVLLAAYERSFDVIYLDPPYNTGNRDWTYNNDYVDPTDTYRPSKWLAFMERRLRIARRLLRPDGVLVITIDENEVHHLGMLLEQLFPDYLIQMVTMVINPKGTGKLNFARVEEHAFYVIPKVGVSLIHGLPRHGGRLADRNALEVLEPAEAGVEADEEIEEDVAEVVGEDDLEAPDEEAVAADDWPFPAEERILWELRHARRRGGESSYRPQRPNQFYPLWIDATARRVVRAGESLPLGQDPDLRDVDGLTPVWPIDREGNNRCWRFIPERMNALIGERRVVLGQHNATTGAWTVNYWVRTSVETKPKTVWWEKSHDAGTHGTSLINKFLGNRGSFFFPKSVYGVKDVLAMVVRKRPDALILDFFAGSGTTLHSTMLLNREYPGQRRCVLVTNNELNYKVAQRLQRQGLSRGDPEFEAAGVFEAATRPRITDTITGKRPDGHPIPGRYVDRRPFADGLEENVEFFRLDYLDAAEIELGLRFPEIHPLLWLKAGGVGLREDLDPTSPLGLPAGSPYAVLFDPSGMPALLAALPGRPDVKTVFIVAESPQAFSQIKGDLPPSVEAVRLYGEYLDALRGAIR
jgi:adenine-specific DNA-methyltransferase